MSTLSISQAANLRGKMALPNALDCVISAKHHRDSTLLGLHSRMMPLAMRMFR